MKFQHTNLPIEEEYPKLVRDRIIELIEKRGGKAEWDTIQSEEKFLRHLVKKLIEESTEANHALAKGNLDEELADIMEIIDEILYLKGWTPEGIRKIQDQKRQTNGGFKKRILLKKIK